MGWAHQKWTEERRERQSEVMRRTKARAWDWLPDMSLRGEYERLRSNAKIPAAEAKRIILDGIRDKAS